MNGELRVVYWVAQKYHYSLIPLLYIIFHIVRTSDNHTGYTVHIFQEH
jgi:hypothetical protein